MPSDDHPCTIDEIVAAVTSPARAEELQGEEALVDAIAAAVIANQPKELVPMTSGSRPLKIGLLAGAAVLSLAGVAAAATTTRVLPDRKPSAPVIAATTTLLDPTSTTTTTAQGSTTTIATTTTAVSDQTTTVPDTSTTVSAGAGTSTPSVTAPPCPPDVQNHGHYVSDVVRTRPRGPTTARSSRRPLSRIAARSRPATPALRHLPPRRTTTQPASTGRRATAARTGTAAARRAGVAATDDPWCHPRWQRSAGRRWPTHLVRGPRPAAVATRCDRTCRFGQWS